MIHYTCDRCKRSIDPKSEIRYVVTIDIQTSDAIAEEYDDDIDQLAELHMELENLHDPIELDETGESNEREQYDLCSDCHRQFSKNPLGRDPLLTFGFSNN